MQFITTFIVLSILGLLNSTYLYYKHRKKEILVCPLHSHCNTVIESQWSTFLGVRNDVLGTLYYLFLLTLILFSLGKPQFQEQIYKVIFPILLTGVIYSGFLTYIQLKRIKNLCLYCLISAFITLLLFTNSLQLLRLL